MIDCSEPLDASVTLAAIVETYRNDYRCSHATFIAMIEEWFQIRTEEDILRLCDLWEVAGKARPAEGGLYTPYPPDALPLEPDEAQRPIPCMACEGTGKAGLKGWNLSGLPGWNKCRTCGGSGIQKEVSS